MATQIAVVEEANLVAAEQEVIDIAIANPVVNVSIVDENIILSVIEEEVKISIIDDRMDVGIIEQPVQIVISDVIIDQVLSEEEEVYDIEVDTSVAGVTYVGQALPGTAKSEALWRIKKITDSAGGSSVDWASGSAAFNKVWDDRLSYVYGP